MSSTDLEECSGAMAIPLPPPPPLPPPITEMFTTRGTTLTDRGETNRLKLIEEACLQSWRVFGQSVAIEEALSILSLYQHCDSVLQSGPTCGLVALMVSLQLVKPELTTDLSQVLCQAQSRGYTKFGEMFSAENMTKFLAQEFSVKAETRQWLEKSRLDVMEHLCTLGNLILVPYDADSNYEPCLKEGKRAHWATLCGFCLVVHHEGASPIPTDQVDCKVANMASNRSLVHIEPKPADSKRIFHFARSYLSRGNLFVYARQGKSKRIQIWNYDQLCKSNRNLCKVSGKILSDPERAQMVYPDNGLLDKSLANQFVMIYK